jgi:hypothetical protein
MKNENALKYRQLTQKVIGVFFEVYNELGHASWSLFIRRHSLGHLPPRASAFVARLKCLFGFVGRRLEVLRPTSLLKNAYYSN